MGPGAAGLGSAEVDARPSRGGPPRGSDGREPGSEGSAGLLSRRPRGGRAAALLCLKTVLCEGERFVHRGRKSDPRSSTDAPGPAPVDDCGSTKLQFNLEKKDASCD